MFIFLKFEFFSDSHSGAFHENLLVKSRNQNIFFQYLNWIRVSDKFPFQWYIVCWGQFSPSKVSGYYHSKFTVKSLLHRKHLELNFSSSILKGEGGDIWQEDLLIQCIFLPFSMIRTNYRSCCHVLSLKIRLLPRGSKRWFSKKQTIVGIWHRQYLREYLRHTFCSVESYLRKERVY